MNFASPVNLVAALVVAGVGFAIFVFVVIRYTIEVRARRRLAADHPAWDGYDEDIRRYLEDVWLVVGSWRPRVEADTRERLDQLWEQMLAEASDLQSARAAGDASSDRIQTMVDLEAEIESVLSG